jgi:GDP-L-fucose synthase
MYPAEATQPIKETEILTGKFEVTNQSYALAKVVGARMVELISEKTSWNWKTFVLSNLYGPFDHFEPNRSHLLAAIIEKTMRAQQENQTTIDIWGDGTARREFTYVEDVAGFILENLHCLGKFPNTLNLGAGVDYTVSEYYKLVASVLGFQGEFSYDLTKPAGMKQKLMDSSLASNHGWSNFTPIRSGVAQTVEWYKSNTIRV